MCIADRWNSPAAVAIASGINKEMNLFVAEDILIS